MKVIWPLVTLEKVKRTPGTELVAQTETYLKSFIYLDGWFLVQEYMSCAKTKLVVNVLQTWALMPKR